MEARKQYTKEFKLDAVSLVLDQGLTIAEAARSLGIRANMLGRWVRESQVDNNNGKAFRGNGKLTPEQAEIRQLKIENKQLKLVTRSIFSGYRTQKRRWIFRQNPQPNGIKTLTASMSIH